MNQTLLFHLKMYKDPRGFHFFGFRKWIFNFLENCLICFSKGGCLKPRQRKGKLFGRRHKKAATSGWARDGWIFAARKFWFCVSPDVNWTSKRIWFLGEFQLTLYYPDAELILLLETLPKKPETRAPCYSIRSGLTAFWASSSPPAPSLCLSYLIINANETLTNFIYLLLFYIFLIKVVCPWPFDCLNGYYNGSLHI